MFRAEDANRSGSTTCACQAVAKQWINSVSEFGRYNGRKLKATATRAAMLKVLETYCHMQGSVFMEALSLANKHGVGVELRALLREAAPGPEGEQFLECARK